MFFPKIAYKNRYCFQPASRRKQNKVEEPSWETITTSISRNRHRRLPNHNAMLSDSLVKYGLALFLPVLYLVYRQYPSILSVFRSSPPQPTPAEADSTKPLKSIMQAPRDNLAPPKDDPFTTEQLKQYDGTDSSKPILVAIKGAPILKYLYGSGT